MELSFKFQDISIKIISKGLKMDSSPFKILLTKKMIFLKLQEITEED